MTSGIYCIQRVGSDECYVGQAADIHRRWSQHRSVLRRCKHNSKHMQNVFNKHGADVFEYAILELVDDQYALTEREQVWLDKFLPVYNTAPAAGSCLGMKHSAETIARMSAGQTGKKRSTEARKNMSAAQAGRKCKPITDAHRANLSAAQLKRPPFTAEHCAAISAVQRGRVATTEQRTAQSARQMGVKRAPLTAEQRAKISAAKKGRKLSASHRASQSAAMMGNSHSLGYKHSSGARANMSTAQLKRWVLRKEQALA